MNHFTDSELHLGDADYQSVINMHILVDTILLPLRLRFGAIVVTSGHRSEEHNKLVKGAKNSHHRCCDGFAAVDIRSSTVELKILFDYIKNSFLYAELILETDQGVIHVSHNTNNEKNIRRTSIRTIVNGQKAYKNIQINR